MKVWTVLCAIGENVVLACGDPNDQSADGYYFYESLNKLVEVLKKQDILISIVKLHRSQCNVGDRFWIEQVDIGELNE